MGPGLSTARDVREGPASAGARSAFRRRDKLALRRSAVVVDVGATGLRAAQSEVARRGACIRDVLRQRWGPFEGDAAPAMPVGRVARALAQGDFGGDRVSLLIAPPALQFHALHLPDTVLQQPPDRFGEALRLDVARESRVEPGEIEVRHWLLPPGHRQRLNVMAVSTPSAAVRGWVDALASSSVALHAVLPLSCAHVRAACERFTPDPRELWGILDLGATRSTFTTIIGTTPSYVRTLRTATQAWARALADGLDVDLPQATELLFEHGLGGDGENVPPAAAELCRVLVDLLRASLDDLVRDVERCFAYLQQSYSELEGGRIFVAGGGALVPGVCSFIELLTGMPTEPLASGDDAGARFDPTTAAVVGGALLEVDHP